jgi:hypothetical protein
MAVNLTVVIDEECPAHWVNVSSAGLDGDELTITVSPRLEGLPLLALAPEFAEAVVSAVEGSPKAMAFRSKTP